MVSSTSKTRQPKRSADKQRLQKVLAAAGLGSRRACEQMIVDGLVSVNGKIPKKLPVLVNPQVDKIVMDGQQLASPKAKSSAARTVRPEKLVYYVLNKPKGVICTNRDRLDQQEVKPSRARAIDLMPDVQQRLVSVGRLDVASHGLLIMTNDGELVNRLTHPSHGASKTYRLRVDGYLEAGDMERLRKGLWLSKNKPSCGGAHLASANRLKIIHRDRKCTVLEMVLTEGRNRQIRRMMARLGYKVRDLLRIKIGPVNIRGLPSGAYRRLTGRELSKLRLLSKT